MTTLTLQVPAALEAEHDDTVRFLAANFTKPVSSR